MGEFWFSMSEFPGLMSEFPRLMSEFGVFMSEFKNQSPSAITLLSFKFYKSQFFIVMKKPAFYLLLTPLDHVLDQVNIVQSFSERIGPL